MTAGVGATVIALAALLAVVLWWARRPTEAVRLRNALRLQPSHEEDFTWVPPHFPPGFAVERREASSEWTEIVASLGIEAIPGDWAKARALAGHLTERAEDKGPVRADPMTTYRAIRAGHGYCADFVKVFPVDGPGVEYIKALRAPLPHLRLVPTGGVDQNNLGEFLKAGCAAVGVGSSLITRQILETSDWPELTRRAAEFVRRAKAVR